MITSVMDSRQSMRLGMLVAGPVGMSHRATATRPPRWLDQVRAAIRLRHYRPKTEEAYVSWIRRFMLFHGKRHHHFVNGHDPSWKYLSQWRLPSV